MRQSQQKSPQMCSIGDISGNLADHISALTPCCSKSPLVESLNYLGLDITKPVFRVPNHSPHEQGLVKEWNVACSKFRYDAFQKANNNGADQSAQMCSVVCAFVVRTPCGYSKEPSQWDGSFEHPKHMLKLMGKRIFTILCSKILFI